MRSIRSWIAERILTKHSNKKNFIDENRFTTFFNERYILNKKPYVLPEVFTKKFDVEKEQFDGMDYYIFNRDRASSNKTIFYLHGGAYVNPPLVFHWEFLGKLAEATGATIYVPIYPKAPHNQYKDSFAKVLPLYEEVRSQSDNKMILMGDSAGGGFALALAQLLLEKELQQPQHIILLSPWLDMTMENPHIYELERRDPMLGIYGLIQIGKVYAGETDTSHYLLSPINGKLKGLGKITLFIGTREILLYDARRLRTLAVSQGIDLNYFEYPKMNHVFPLYPIPEAKKAMKEMVEIIKKR